MLLAGDIGGTKTELGVYSPEAGLRAPLARGEYTNADYPSPAVIVQEFLARAHQRVTLACFAVAGPVIDGRAKLTNLPWMLDETALARDLQLDAVHLLNDLLAIAHAVPNLEAEDLHTLNAGVPEPRGAVAVIAPGTGLGEAFLTWDGSRYHAYPSEGGHADFAPGNAMQVGLLQYLWQRHTHVSAESVCSGLGIPNLYRYLRDSGHAPETPAVAQRLAAAQDPTPVIVQAGLDESAPCALCAATIDMFIEILGAEAGNLALKVLATGGVYLAGGIPKRILPALVKSRILDAFRSKGRFADLLDQVPVHVVVQQAALVGAASYGLSLA
jgi:glucokinase